jgi:hypothetical protein
MAEAKTPQLFLTGTGMVGMALQQVVIVYDMAQSHSLADEVSIDM